MFEIACADAVKDFDLFTWVFIGLFATVRLTFFISTAKSKEKKKVESSIGRWVLFSTIFLASTSFLFQITLSRDDPTWSWAFVCFGRDWQMRAVILGLLSSLFFMYVHSHLGLNWSGYVTLRENHSLVTSGPYSVSRHPMYLCFICFVIAFMASTGYIVSSGFFVLCLVYALSRIPVEEKLLSKEFGQEHEKYCEKVPMIVGIRSLWALIEILKQPAITPSPKKKKP